MCYNKLKKKYNKNSDSSSISSFESESSRESKSDSESKIKFSTNLKNLEISSDSEFDSDSESEDFDNLKKIKKEKNLNYNRIQVRKKILDEFSGSENSDSDQDNNNIPIRKSIKSKIVITKNSNEIFKELITKQLPDVPTQWKLNINDMKRICKYIKTSIFDENYCCMWNGYITNMNNSNKGTYVNFYFRNKKVALHRLLYSNFVAPLDSSEYLKFNCDNKGICCNINHYEKYKYTKNNMSSKGDIKKRNETKKETKNVTIVGSDDPGGLIINFD